MRRCHECKKWFILEALLPPSDLWSDGTGICVFCAEPWKEHDVPKGIDEVPSHFDLLEKMQVRHTRTEVLLPFAHDPKNYYVEATIYEGKDRCWFIEGRNVRLKTNVEAVSEVVRTADARRLKTLNEEFEKEFGENGRNPQRRDEHQ